MIISRGRGYVFVHIPKTGGTSMALALEGRAMKDDILIGDTPKAQRRKGRLKQAQTRGRLWKHSTLADVEGLLDQTEMADLFIFTLVRNPWDRMVSYYHWLQDQTFDHPAVALAKASPFAEFVMAPLTEATFRAAPYTSYLTDGAGTHHGDLYIRLEHFAEDAAPLMDLLGFDLTLPHANPSTRARDWRPYYTDATAAQLERICAADITTHGYAFDP